MYNNYSLEVKRIFKDAEKIAIDLNHPYIGTEHLLLSLINNDDKIKKILLKYDLTYDEFLDELLLVVGTSENKKCTCIYTPLLKRVIKTADEISKNKMMEPMHLLEAILEEGEGIAIRIIISMGIDIDKLYDEIKKKHKKGNTKLELYNIGKDMSEINSDDILVGREKELNLIIETLLRKNKNNPLLIGEPGIGKTALVEALAYKIVKKEVPKELLNKTIISINISKIVSGTRYRGEFEEKFHKMIEYFEQNNNLIIFFDEIHTIVGAGGAEGAIDASNILKPYIARNKLKIIGATTTKEYYKSIYNDGALNRRFQTILIKEPTTKETLNILINSKKYYEKFHNVHITNKQLETIIDLSNKYIKDRYNPDKSLDMLDKICSKIKLQHIETDTINNLNELKEQKINYIKNKEFSKAKQISNKINNYKTNKLKIDNNTIYESFNIDKKVSFGFSS